MYAPIQQGGRLAACVKRFISFEFYVWVLTDVLVRAIFDLKDLAPHIS